MSRHNNSMDFTKNRIGVSPVIGIILLVALTVGIVALTSVFVLDIGGDTTESADAATTVEDGDTVVLIRDGNVDGITVEDKDGDSIGSMSDPGDSVTIESKETHQVVAEIDGEEQLIRTIDSDEIMLDQSVVLDGDSEDGEFVQQINVGDPTIEEE